MNKYYVLDKDNKCLTVWGHFYQALSHCMRHDSATRIVGYHPRIGNYVAFVKDKK